MSNLCVFSTGVDLDLFKASCSHVMITPCLYDVCHWKGYVHGKLEEGIKFLLTRHEQFAMWVDSNDSLVLKPEGEIIARLLSFGGPVVIAGEATCWPDADKADGYKRKHPWVGHSGLFINAGGFIGHRELVLTAMHGALASARQGDQDDQRAWTTAYLSDLIPAVQVDHGRRIFASVGDGEAALKADSCVKHWNGRLPGRKEYWERVYGPLD